MSTSTIGIKVADRSYYPVLERDKASRKRLVLTTVKDDQTNVQIDLYENTGETMQTAKYVGSLLIENIDSAKSGEAEIELILSVDDERVLGASASESSSGERQSLSVSLESLGDDGIYDIPEFELEDDLENWNEDGAIDDIEDLDEDSYSDDLSSDYGDDFDSDTEFDSIDEPAETVSNRRRPLMFGLFIVLGVAAVVLITLLIFKLVEGPKVPPLEGQGTSTGIEQVADNAGSAADDSEASGGGPAVAQATVTPEPVDMTSYIQPKDQAQLGGAWYWIRRGDTLWALSASFYRNPWLFRVIAEQNSISNPDLIFAGDRIYIPPR